MSSIVKPLIAAMLALIATLTLLLRTDTVTTRWSNEELSYALQIATQDATAVIYDTDFMFGEDEEAEAFNVDLNKALHQFQSSFFANIGSTLSELQVNDMSVSMAGYAGYRYIYATYNDGKTTIPYGYTYYANNKLYEFTLGDNVYVTDMSSMKETVWKLSDLSEHYFSNALTNENFRIVTIMTAINNFLNTFYNDDANVIAYNAGTGIEFDLGMVDYASDDVNVMEKLSAVIDGPSFFAVVDTYDTLTNRTVRLFSLGAAEYKSLVA